MLRQHSFIGAVHHEAAIKIIGAQTPITKDIVEYSSTNNPSNITELKASLYQSIFSTRMNLIDKRRGIESNRHTIGNGQNSFWLRIIDISEDTAIEINEHKRDFLYNYLRLFYAYLLGAISIDVIYSTKDKDELVNEILTLQHSTDVAFNEILKKNLPLEECESSILELISHKKHALVDLMKKRLNANSIKRSGFKGTQEKIINKMLDQAKDWVALEQQSVSIYTVIKTDERYFNKKRILITDQPCTIVTDEQKKLINNRHKEIWYKELLPFQQEMVDYYADKLLEGRVVPSQLRSVIPLGKNSYRQSVYIERDDETFEELNSYFHSGTAAYLSHKNNDIAQEITRHNLIQQKINAGADISLMIALNSSLGDSIVGAREKMLGHVYTADDSKIIELTSKAADPVNGLYYSKICLNGFRKLEPKDYGNIPQIITQIEANISLINDDANAEIKLMRQLIRKLQSLMAKWLITEKDNVGTEIIYTLCKLTTLNNNLKSIKNDVITIAIWFGCASGENRTGLSYYHNISRTLIDYCKANGLSLTTDDKKQILTMVANSEHIHIMTGNQGSTFGTEGIRGKSKGTANADYPVEELVTTIADAKAIASADEIFDAALKKLQLAIKANLKSPFVSDIINHAKNLYHYAQTQRPKIADKEFPDEAIHLFAEALNSTSTLLTDFKSNNLKQLTDCLEKINPKKDNTIYTPALSPINIESTKHKSHPIFHNTQRNSWKMIVFGCLLGIAAAAITAIAVTAAVSTFGVATPLAALGITLGYTIAAKAIAITATAATTSVLCLSTFFAKKGTEQRNNVAKNVAKICHHSAKKISH